MNKGGDIEESRSHAASGNIVNTWLAYIENSPQPERLGQQTTEDKISQPRGLYRADRLRRLASPSFLLLCWTWILMYLKLASLILSWMVMRVVWLGIMICHVGGAIFFPWSWGGAVAFSVRALRQCFFVVGAYAKDELISIGQRRIPLHWD